MNETPTISERLSASLGTALYGAPVSFMFWLIANWALRHSGGVNMLWVAAGAILFAVLGFLFPRAIGQKLRFK